MSMKVQWQPIEWNGSTFYVCTVETLGHRVQATSRRKPDALSFALEELAKVVITTKQPDP